MKSDESRVRAKAQRAGYAVRKSRQRKVPNLDNFGQFMLIDIDHNGAVLGSRFDASIDDIEAFLDAA